MKTDPVNSPAAQSPGPNPNPMQASPDPELERQIKEFERQEDIEPDPADTPPPQTWKHPDDGKTLSDTDEERPLKP